MATLSIDVELSGSGGGWTDITADLRMNPPLDITYGIPGAGPLDLVARTGHMVFALDNSASNSGGKLGYYSPEHANVRAGFKVGIGVRIRYVVSATTYYKFTGWIDSIDPIAGQYGERLSRCVATDWMGEAAVFRPNVPTQIDKRFNEVVSALVSSVQRQPTSTNYDTCEPTFPFALDNAESNTQPVLTQLQQVAQSEFGRVYVKGDTTAGGVLRVEKRTARLVPSSVQTFSDSMVSLRAPHERNRVVNKVKATSHPRTFDTSGTAVLFVNNSAPFVAGNTSKVITGQYRDPNARAIRIGGKDMVPPVAGTDYAMNVSTSGGTNVTANFTVSASYGANQVVYTISNTSATDGYVTLLQARGNGLYDYSPIENIASSSSSMSTYGERPLVLDMLAQSNAPIAQAVADYIVKRYKDPTSNEVMIELVGYDAATLAKIAPIEPGDAITISETLTGVNHVYHVNQVHLTFETPNIVRGEWLCALAQSSNAYWTLGVAGKSELGVTTVLAPL